MCRLVAYHGPPIPLSRPVFGGTHSLARQSWEPRELLSGSVNADGWGVTWWPGGAERPVRIARAEPIWFDPDLPRLLGSLAASSIVAALRNTTPGLPVDRTGLLPIIRDRWAFALNGYVPAFRARHMRRLREQLPDGFYARLEGVADSETLMHLALAGIAGGATPAEALVDVRDRVAARLAPREVSPLTMVLADGNGGTILHTAVNGEVNSLYVCRRGGLMPEGIVIASERLDIDEGWERVPDHSIVEYGPEGVRIAPL